MLTNLLSQFHPIGFEAIGLIFSIVIMDAALSGDNSIAITALANRMGEKHRQNCIYLGMVLAGILRFVALFFVAFIIKSPWVQILGALYLIKLCVGHFMEVEDEKIDGDKTLNKAGFFSTLIAIGILDLSLSLDNVIAITAMTTNLTVIFIGVAISIAMLAVATKVTQWAMSRFPGIQDAAYVILGFLGLNMICQHGSEFLIWVGALIHKHHVFLETFKLDIGDLGEIIVVALILGSYIGWDLFKGNNKKNSNCSVVLDIDTV